jgi:peptide/nickel transport system permease protein
MSDTYREPVVRKKEKAGYLKMCLHNSSFMAGCIIVFFILILALFPQFFATHDPNEINPNAILQGPSRENFFGTDNYGRDIYSRVIWATRVDISIGVFGALVPFFIGSILGLLTGYYGGILDTIVMRILDVLMAFPFTVLVIAIMSVLGTGIHNVYIALWSTGWMTFCRLVRAETLVLKKIEFLQAANVSGFSDARILFRHMLPNVIAPAIVFLASEIVMCLLTGASMSFLGLGVQPPQSEWGYILNTGRGFISFAWWMTVFAGLFLSITGIGFSLIGDGLTDFLRTKGR